jgi:hypothetical protein
MDAAIVRTFSSIRRALSSRLCFEGGSLGAANFAQVRTEAVAKGLITNAEIDAMLARLEAPDFAVFSPVMFTAWGRRAGFAASHSDHDSPASPRAGEQHLPPGHLP